MSGPAFGQARGRGGEIEDLADAAADAAGKGGRVAKDRVLAGHPSFQVGQVAERREHGPAGQPVFHLHAVPGRVNVGIGSAHVGVGGNASGGSELQPGGLGQGHVGGHADGEDHKRAGQFPAVGQTDAGHLAVRAKDGRDANAGQDGRAF